MHISLNFCVALLATSALAAPTPKQKEQKSGGHHPFGAFKIPSRARPNHIKNLDTHHEMSRAYAKFDLDLILPSIDLPASHGSSHGASAAKKLSLPDVPAFVSNLLNNVLPLPTWAPKTWPAHGPKQSSTVTAAYTPAPYYGPSSTEAPVATSSAAPVYTVAPTSAAPETTETSTVAPTTSAEPETSTVAPTTSTVPETSTVAPVTSVAPETSTVAPVTSVAPETSTVTPIESVAPETSTIAPVTSAAPVSSATSASSAAPEFSTPPALSSAVAESSTVAPVTSAAPVSSEPAPTTLSTIQPSFSFAPTTTVAAPASTTTKKVGGTVNATPEQNESEYLSPVTVGGQSFTLNFDTGSADLWVFSNKLSADQIGQHAAFDPTKSSTWQPADGYSWKISYGDGSNASGDVGFDTVVIGGATATHQAVEIATAVSTSFVKDANNDGLVGLGWSNINTIKPQAQKTFFENIMADLDQPLFTADLRQDASGTYEFGAIDSTKYSGEIHYTPIDNSKGFWQFPSTSYTINGQTYQNANAAPAIADTGTSIVLADSSAVAAYYAQVQGSSLSTTAGGYIFPCSAQLPEYGVAIGSSGFTATIPGSEMVYADLKDGTCFGGLQSNTGINYQIFGDVLLKQYFAVFNGGAKTFGIAKKA